MRGTVWRAVLVMKRFKGARKLALGDMGRICQVMIGVKSIASWVLSFAT